MKKSCELHKPPGVDAAAWKQAVVNAWNQSDAVCESSTQLDDADVSVQREWDAFQELVSGVLKSALLSFADNAYDWETREDCRRRGASDGPKGSLASRVVLPLTKRGPTHETGDMATCKCRRKLACLYEYRRLLQAACRGEPNRQQQTDLHSLRAKVVRWFGRVLALHEVVRIIGEWSVELAAKVKSKRDEKIRSDPGEAIFVIPMLLLVGGSVPKLLLVVRTCLAKMGLLQRPMLMLVPSFLTFGIRSGKTLKKTVTRCMIALRICCGICPKELKSLGDFPSRAAKARGSSGPDTWCGAELRALPSPGLTCLLGLLSVGCKSVRSRRSVVRTGWFCCLSLARSMSSAFALLVTVSYHGA